MRDEPPPIEGETTVAALLERWPTLVEAFRRRGLSCPGCAMSRFDALDYVAGIYGLRLREWLRELRREAGRGRTRPHRRMSHATD